MITDGMWTLSLIHILMGTIKCNLTFSMALNFIAIILAAGGILSPVAGARFFCGELPRIFLAELFPHKPLLLHGLSLIHI